MTEDRRLRDKLAKLAAEEDGGGARRLSARPGGDLTSAILEEMDETILARMLAFRADDGAELRLEVANRRLLGLVDLPPDAAERGDRDALLSPLPADDEAALAAVAGAIRQFAAGRSGITVTSAPLGRAVGSGMLGRSAAAVARALGIDLYDRPAAAAMPDPARGFEAGLARLALAVAIVEGGEPSPATGPDAKAVDRLSALDGDAFACLAAELGPEGARGGRYLLMTGGDQAFFLGASEDGRAVAAILPSADAGTVAALWRATTGA